MNTARCKHTCVVHGICNAGEKPSRWKRGGRGIIPLASQGSSVEFSAPDEENWATTSNRLRQTRMCKFYPTRDREKSMERKGRKTAQATAKKPNLKNTKLARIDPVRMPGMPCNVFPLPDFGPHLAGFSFAQFLRSNFARSFIRPSMHAYMLPVGC